MIFEPLTRLKQRLTLDLDSNDFWYIYKIYDKLVVDGFKPEVFKTQNGYHIECPLKPTYGFWEILNLRKKYEDDEI